MADTIIGASTAVVAVAVAGYAWYAAWSERRFQRRYAEFKRQQRENRTRFFETLDNGHETEEV